MLVFIDTNILLDFYRSENGTVAKQQLKQIEDVKDNLIITYQVEMEYKKNRQSVILQYIENFKFIENFHKTTLPLLSDSKPFQSIKTQVKKIEQSQKDIRSRIEKILTAPNVNDKVYMCAQRLFNHRSPYNLNRERKERFKIRMLAKKRHILGYPPRKPSDLSIGDAVNWEWIISCAKQANDDVIIVSRDKDYGTFYQKSSYINDWLKQEFKERVNRQKNVKLTNKLSEALEALNVKVTAEEREFDKQLIRLYTKTFRYPPDGGDTIFDVGNSEAEN